MGKSNFACSSLSSIFTFNAPDFPKGSNEVQVHDSLSTLIKWSSIHISFSTTVYTPFSFIPRHTKEPISSPLLSSCKVEQSCYILVFLKLKVLSEIHSSSPNSSFPLPLGPLLRVSSSTIWILHEGIISFPNFLCFHNENLRLKHDSNYLNSFKYV